MARTSPKPSPPTCRESTSRQADSRVRTFLYLAGKEGLPENEALSFLKSLDSSKARLPKIDPNGLSLKMLKICSPLIEDGTLRPFSIRWPKSAIISHRHHAECGIPAGFRAGEHDALQFGVHYHAQSGVFRPCQALEAPEHFRRADELCHQCRRRLRADQVRLGAGAVYQPFPQRYRALPLDDDAPRRGCVRQCAEVKPCPTSKREMRSRKR